MHICIVKARDLQNKERKKSSPTPKRRRNPIAVNCMRRYKGILAKCQATGLHTYHTEGIQ